MIETGTLLQDRYLIERRIGVGGMGAVYLAVDQRFGSNIAIKETFYKNDEFGEAFEREAHLLNSLQHPALPHVMDYFTENNGHFLVMQFIEGADLFEILKQAGAFPIADVLRWTDSLLDALDYLHSQEPPVIHRDIKPQNLKLTPRSDIILLDFGLAKLNHEDTTGVKSVFGYSRKYSPLEQIQGTGTDARSDIFALGATAYHLLTGKPPIDVLARAAEIVAGNPDPLPTADNINGEVSPDVATVLHTALALNPDQRFASAKMMREALALAVDTASTENAEEIPEQAFAAAAASHGAITTAEEVENFTALEAFAADAANAPPQINDNDGMTAVEIQTPAVREPSPSAEVLPESASVVEVATRVSPRADQSRLRVAALLATLIFVGLAAGYFISEAISADEAGESPVVQTASESNSNTEQPATVSDLPTPEVSESPLLEEIEQAKTKPRVIERAAEKRETADEPPVPVETTEKPKPAPAVAAPRSTPAVKSRRVESQQTGEMRSRVATPPPASDIESVFTGESAERQEIREERRRRREDRQRREQMSDDEWQELRRRRQERRWERRNTQRLPF